MGQIDIIEKTPGRKNDNSGRERDITKFRMRMKHAVRDDLLQYLQRLPVVILSVIHKQYNTACKEHDHTG